VVGVAQLVEHWIVAPVVAGSSPVTHPMKIPGLLFPRRPLSSVVVIQGKVGPLLFVIHTAGVVELVDTLDLGSSAVRCGGSSPSTRTIQILSDKFLSSILPDEELRFCRSGRRKEELTHECQN
jgi:hypothetical protein